MIKMIRLDERLIHGQVATSWAKRLAVDSIMVIDDESANNPILTSSLLIAAPENCRTFVMTYDEAIGILQDARCKTRSILVVTKEIDNLLRLASEAPDIEEFNIGNYGRIQARKPGEKRQGYESNLYLYEEEKAKLIQLCKTGYTCSYQTTADTAKINLLNLLGK